MIRLANSIASRPSDLIQFSSECKISVFGKCHPLLSPALNDFEFAKIVRITTNISRQKCVLNFAAYDQGIPWISKL